MKSERPNRMLLPSPIPDTLLMVEYADDGVRAIRYFPQGSHPPAGTRVEPSRDDRVGWEAARQLREYFRGERREFDLPLAPEGTAFQREVWEALRAIPFGATCSYADVARRTGRSPRASRAVGAANARNPLPIVVPCHRVIAADGGLGGYMGAGPDGDGAAVKRWLLRHEGVRLEE